MTYIVCFEPDQKKEYRIIILILPIDIKNHFLYDKVKDSSWLTCKLSLILQAVK